MNESSRIIIDREMIKNLSLIGVKCKEVFSCKMRTQNLDILLDSLIDVHFRYSDDVAELADNLDNTLEILNLYADRLKGAGLL